MPYDGLHLSGKNPVLFDRIKSIPGIEWYARDKRDCADEGEYCNIKITLYDMGRIKMRLSIHKYWNLVNGDLINGLGHNADDFSLSACKAALTYLVQDFGPEVLDLKIDNVEFGFNIELPYTAKDFIDRNVIMLRRGALRKHAIRKGARGLDDGHIFDFQEQGLKIYNKGKQFNIAENLLRCEVVITKMRKAPKSLAFLSDLVHIENAVALFETFKNLYADILTAEDVNICAEKIGSRKHKAKTRLYLRCINPDYWYRILTEKSRRAEKKQEYTELINEYGTSNYKATVMELLTAKCRELVLSQSVTITPTLQK